MAFFQLLKTYRYFQVAQKKKELKLCFNKKMQKHFQRKFNADLPNYLVHAPEKKE